MADKKQPSERKDSAGGRAKSANPAKPGGKISDPDGAASGKGSPKSGAAKPASGKAAGKKASAPKAGRTTAKSASAATSKSVSDDAAKAPASDAASGAKPTQASTSDTAAKTGPADPWSAASKDAAATVGKPSTSPAADTKPADTRPAASKDADTAATAGKPGDDKPSSSPATDAKPAETRPAAQQNDTAARPTSAPDKPAPADQRSQPRRGGFFALLLGGVCAAAIGFGAAYYILPQMGIPGAEDTSGADEAAAEQSQRIDALEARIDQIPAAPDTSAFEAGQADMAAQISDLTERVDTLASRLSDIEAQPTGADGSGVSTGQLNDLRQTVKAQGDKLAALVADAEERDNAARASAQQDLRRAALTRIRAALDTGTPFAPALGDLERAGMSAPDALQDVAEDGVPTLAALQDSFAPAARAALATSRKEGSAEQQEGGFWSFMSDQLGARSLERREGPGTDATLSRAEDDLRQGKLSAALDEIETLPDAARAALSDWAERARARMQAVSAYDALAAKLN